MPDGRFFVYVLVFLVMTTLATALFMAHEWRYFTAVCVIYALNGWLQATDKTGQS